MNLRRFKETLNKINEFGALDKGNTRLAYSPEVQAATAYFIQLCEQEGLKVHVDPCGNVIARREGNNPSLPAVALGSHLDTVIQGGKYDGTIGVIGALEVVRSLNDREMITEHPIEIIAFACEESSRFGVSTIGSKLMAGLINKESLRNLTDRNGVTFPQTISDYSLNFEQIDRCKRNSKELKVFFELHIEQGPLLEQKKKKIGIVHGIASPTRFSVKVVGQASHSGTTPMDQRRDALLGAAELTCDLETAAKQEAERGTVATVGVFEVLPGAMNVVPGEVRMKIDIRGTSKESKKVVIQNLFQSIKRVERERKLKIDWILLSDEETVHLHPEVVTSLNETCEKLSLSYEIMASGAGHDAMNMARLCPTGLVFVPSREGISHHPDEFTDLNDIMLGIRLLEEEVSRWAHSYPRQLGR